MPQEESQQTFTETARRAQIIQSAIAAVNELGYHKASLAEIAKRAQVAKSAIVYYFGSKDTLLLHVLEHVFSALGTAIETAVEAAATPDGRLRAYAESYLAHVNTHRREVAAGVTIVLSHREADGTPLYLQETDEDTALLRSILSEGMEAGILRPMPLHTAATITDSLLDVAVSAVQRDLDADLSKLTPEIMTFLFAGLMTERPRQDSNLSEPDSHSRR